MSEQPKFCRDCRHYWSFWDERQAEREARKWWQPGLAPLYLPPPFITFACKRRISLVTGTADERSAFDERGANGSCGPMAQFWEAKTDA